MTGACGPLFYSQPAGLRYLKIPVEKQGGAVVLHSKMGKDTCIELSRINFHVI